MKIGTIILVGLFLAGFVVWKYSDYMKRALTGVAGVLRPNSAPNSTTPSANTNARLWFTGNLWTILLILAGAGICCLGLYAPGMKTLKITDMGDWSWSHWIPLLALWGILAAIVAINAKTAAKVLQGILMWAMIVLFIIIPAFTWVTGIGNHFMNPPAPPPAIEKMEGDMILPVGGKSSLVTVPKGKTLTWTGKRGFRIHCVYRDGHEEAFLPGTGGGCTGDAPYGYTSNEGGANTLIVHYLVH